MVKGYETDLFESSFNKVFDGLHEVTKYLVGWEFVYDEHEKDRVNYISFELKDDDDPATYRAKSDVRGDSVFSAIYDTVCFWHTL